MRGMFHQAVAFAARKHEGQYRKDGKTPYIVHPMRVAFITRHIFECDRSDVHVAALLHDVIEDTKTDYDQIVEKFGKTIADIVAALTKDMRLPEDQRETTYDITLSRASWEARIVKLADVYDNYDDSYYGEQQAEAKKKAQRAILCAGFDDVRLATAIKAVQNLIGG
jgi:guanosine-3',5'-bis(diphosphate) 3'-pyrophosphohydrolase